MRLLALSMMMILSFVVGCEKPMEETYPSPSSATSSGTTDVAADSTEAPPESDVKPAESTDAKPAENATPATDAVAPETPATEAPPAEKPATEGAPPKEGSAANAKTSATKLVAATLKVPTMACPHGCWPTVKETLTKQPGVEAVELAKQANETEINNPQVFLKLNGKFDADAAIAALAEAGFADAKVVN